MGRAPCAIINADDRAPIWPQGVVGSITHTGRLDDGFAAAAVASSEDLQSLGLDAEAATPLADNLFSRVLTGSEQSQLVGLEHDAAGRLAKLYFSAKEAFYKCQYPLTREFLGFKDVELDLDLERGSFSARLLKRAGVFAPNVRFHGRFRVTEDLVLTAVEYPHQ
jgi:4'-phosphopantetheinyl transferase EntD